MAASVLGDTKEEEAFHIKTLCIAWIFQDKHFRLL